MINTFRNFATYALLIAALASGRAYADDIPVEIEAQAQELSQETEKQVQQKAAEQTTSKVSAELMGGNESSTLDVVAKGEIAPKVKFLLRDRNTVNYEQNAIDTFALVDLGINLIDLLDLLGEVQFTQGSEFMPRTGARYLHEFGDLSLFFLTTASLRENPDIDLNPIIQYTPNFNEGLKGYFSLEELTNITLTGTNKVEHNFSLQRIRIGVDIGGYLFGAAGDLKETGNEGKIEYNVGGFIGKRF